MTIFYKCLYGSQNYHLDNENSDIDIKILTIPTLDDLIKEKKTSKTIEIDTGQADVKDIRKMFEQILKCNPSYIEVLLNKYVEVNTDYQDEYNELISLRDRILRYNLTALYKATLGTIFNKERYVFNIYPTTEANITKYGYDGKNASHILRLKSFIKKVLDNEPFEECFDAKTYDNYKLILDLKNHKIDKGLVADIVNQSIANVKLLGPTIPIDVDIEVKGLMYDLADRIIKKSIKEEILNVR